MPVVRFRGWNLALGVCYDLRFPVWCRNRVRAGEYAYDAVIFAANWPDARAYALTTLLKARAIENQAYAVCANRSGSDDYGRYDGLSLIVDFLGMPMAQTQADAADPEAPIYAVFSHDDLDKSRRKLPAAVDADSFRIDFA